MNTYSIPRICTCIQEIYIDAHTEQEAIEQAKNYPWLRQIRRKDATHIQEATIKCYTLTDEQGRVILPGDRVFVTQFGSDTNDSFLGIVDQSTTDPVSVIDFDGGLHRIPAAHLAIIQSIHRDLSSPK